MNPSRIRGFSMIEMIVSLAIFVFLTTAFIINYNTVNSRIAVDNEANEIALWIREAQAYAMGIRALGTNMTPTYGIYFDPTQPTAFILYVDRFNSAFTMGTLDKRYNSTILFPCGDANSECIKQIPLSGGMRISGISAKDALGNTVTPSQLDISFTRPSADARIQDSVPNLYTEGEVSVVSPKGFSRAVNVIPAGQIIVK
jgi:prepilin-type N-terminal cleavage/methylation domain-containing protein